MDERPVRFTINYISFPPDCIYGCKRWCKRKIFEEIMQVFRRYFLSDLHHSLSFGIYFYRMGYQWKCIDAECLADGISYTNFIYSYGLWLLETLRYTCEKMACKTLYEVNGYIIIKKNYSAATIWYKKIAGTVSFSGVVARFNFCVTWQEITSKCQKFYTHNR